LWSAVTLAVEVSMVKKVLVTVSSTPTLSSSRGAKMMREPTTAPPKYLPSPVTPAAAVPMVEKVEVAVLSTPTLSSKRGTK